MQELSMNVLDVAENSVRAGATLVTIEIVQSTAQKKQTLTIEDNGCGMDEELLVRVTDPFTTSRTTRKVGLGLPFLKMAAQQADGDFAIESCVGKGTKVSASFTLGHIDLMPLGDIGSSISALCQSAPDIDFVFTFRKDEAAFTFDTREARRILEGVPFGQPEVALFIRQHVNEGVQEVLAAE